MCSHEGTVSPFPSVEKHVTNVLVSHLQPKLSSHLVTVSRTTSMGQNHALSHFVLMTTSEGGGPGLEHAPLCRKGPRDASGSTVRAVENLAGAGGVHIPLLAESGFDL